MTLEYLQISESLMYCIEYLNLMIKKGIYEVLCFLQIDFKSSNCIPVPLSLTSTNAIPSSTIKISDANYDEERHTYVYMSIHNSFYNPHLKPKSFHINILNNHSLF